jgi:hypothetical protein
MIDRRGLENSYLSARTSVQVLLERKPGEPRRRSGGGPAHEPCVEPRRRWVQRQRRYDAGEDAIVTKAMREEERSAGRMGCGHTEVRPTPIWVSKRTRTVLLLSVPVALVLLTWIMPSVPVY